MGALTSSRRPRRGEWCCVRVRSGTCAAGGSPFLGTAPRRSGTSIGRAPRAGLWGKRRPRLGEPRRPRLHSGASSWGIDCGCARGRGQGGCDRRRRRGGGPTRDTCRPRSERRPSLSRRAGISSSSSNGLPARRSRPQWWAHERAPLPGAAPPRWREGPPWSKGLMGRALAATGLTRRLRSPPSPVAPTRTRCTREARSSSISTGWPRSRARSSASRRRRRRDAPAAPAGGAHRL